MEPWQSWAAALTLGGAAAYYYTRPKQATPSRKASLTEQVLQIPQQVQQVARKQKEKRSTKAGSGSLVQKAQENVQENVAAATQAATGREQASTKQAKKRKSEAVPKTSASPPTLGVATGTPRGNEDGDDDDVNEDAGMDDKEWARQLEARKKGVQIASSSKQTTSNTANKQAAQVRKPETNGSTPSSGASPVARGSSAGRSGVDVSDMLEPSAAAPTSIRITGEEKQKKVPTPKVPEDKQTKKQRQNQRKNEEAKAQREEDDRTRLVLLEQQRRTAREARGEPAKNGLGDAQKPSASVWTANGTSEDSVAREAVTVQLLDTFGDSTTRANDSHTNSSSDPSSNGDASAATHETGATGWSEVSTSKKAKKKTTVVNGTSGETSQPVMTAQKEVSNKPASAASAAPAKTKSSTNGYAALMEETSYTPRTKGHPEDSDWAVE